MPSDRSPLREPEARLLPAVRCWYVPPKIAVPNPGLHIRRWFWRPLWKSRQPACHLRGSIALTTNLGFPSWGRIFDDPRPTRRGPSTAERG